MIRGTITPVSEYLYNTIRTSRFPDKQYNCVPLVFFVFWGVGEVGVKAKMFVSPRLVFKQRTALDGFVSDNNFWTFENNPVIYSKYISCTMLEYECRLYTIEKMSIIVTLGRKTISVWIGANVCLYLHNFDGRSKKNS